MCAPNCSASGMEQNLYEGIVFTGGGAMLNGMCDMAERVSIARPGTASAQGNRRLAEELDSPLWTTAAGLSLYSGEAEAARRRRRRRPD